MSEDPPKRVRWYKGRVADMLRASGYMPLPRMWVTKEQYDQVVAIAKTNENHVTAVRRYCNELRKKEEAEGLTSASDDAK